MPGVRKHRGFWEGSGGRRRPGGAIQGAIRLLGGYALQAAMTAALAAESGSTVQVVPRTSCPQAAAAAAYVCCDGDGGFAVCSRRPGGDARLWAAVLEHEGSHIGDFLQRLPGACAGRDAGFCTFTMTPSQRNEHECRGYRAEHRALTQSLGGAEPREIRGILARQHLLEREGAERFGCAVSPPSYAPPAPAVRRLSPQPMLGSQITP